MRIFLAGCPAEQAGDAVIVKQYPNHLLSFATLNYLRHWARVWQEMTAPAHVLVDSGAFTVHNSGGHVSLSRYESFVKESRESLFAGCASVEFMTLDVIGDQKATWANYETLRRRGCDVIPIVTCGDGSMDDIDRACQSSDYIAFGALTWHAHQDPSVWLRKAALRLMEHRERTGVMPKAHLLGVSSRFWLSAFPAFSADATSWLAPLRYGITRLKGVPRGVRYNRGSSERAATRLALEKNVEIVQTLADEMTALWRARGVAWKEDE